MDQQSVTLLWRQFKEKNPTAKDTYQAWAFGDGKSMADELSDLVVKGVKTATASNYALYERENEPLPQVGDYSVILDGSEKAVAIIETTSVEVIPFKDVSATHAFLEGEGDRSLNYWREVHEAFFKKECEEVGHVFSEDMLVVCARFTRVF
ncbi:RNA-binding protein [Halolactibacillus alkaliphilus]|uniref:RNA-binding protein n=1 Tax=Halolactibacillus alkaliphilus TaxID=442899 RepID=A0A511WXD9_9BACI|nr:ASCH domain-containing protein [Halolactibacillus alkaliphilus]GEN55617.1 RNA-binding protein [Halolactibacillus alkaliphilus]GGN63736.1 RNA-binding protein [Halolactibacillus alkaliphilus]SFO62536.1 Uncharacterized protein YhfF [Halolactibacillus alkaliphilus]